MLQVASPNMTTFVDETAVRICQGLPCGLCTMPRQTWICLHVRYTYLPVYLCPNLCPKQLALTCTTRLLGTARRPRNQLRPPSPLGGRRAHRGCLAGRRRSSGSSGSGDSGRRGGT